MHNATMLRETVPCDACGGTGRQEITHVARLRRELGLTQKQLAERVGVSERTIAKWEAGGSVPHRVFIEKVEALANAKER